MFGIGGNELLLILLFGFLIFGPEKLPGIASTIGKAIARFRDAQQDMNNVLQNELGVDAAQAAKNPLGAIEKMASNQEKKSASSTTKSTVKTATTATATTATANSAAADSTATKADNAAASQPSRPESFTERKARYERERAARLAKEADGEESETQEKPADSVKPAADSALRSSEVKSDADSTSPASEAEADTPSATETSETPATAESSETQTIAESPEPATSDNASKAAEPPASAVESHDAAVQGGEQ